MPAKRKKDELTQQIEAARTADRYMIAVWKVQDGKLDLFRVTQKFPIADFAEALAMLQRDLQPQKDRTPPA